MSTVMKKILMVLVALTLPFALIGCAKKEEPTQKEIDKIVTNAVTATAEAETFKFDMDMLMTIKVTGGAQPFEMTMVTDGVGAIDNANKEAQITTDMTTDIPSVGKVEAAMEMYIVGGWMYMKIDIPQAGEQWMKMPATGETWDARNPIESQLAFLETATEVNFADSEEVNGTICYVMDIVPSSEAISEWLGQQQLSGTEGIDWGELDLASLFKEMSYKYWIAKDSHLLMKLEADWLMQISDEDVGAAEVGFEKMTLDIEMKLYNIKYNQAVSIELPEEASAAQEIPGQK